MYYNINTKTTTLALLIALFSGCSGGGTSDEITTDLTTQSDSSLQIESSQTTQTTETATQNDGSLKIQSIQTLQTNENSSIIKWELTKYATGQVEYGFDDSYGDFSVKEESFDWDAHILPLNNLESGTTYHYRVMSEDADGNKIVSQDKTFKTQGTTTTEPTVAPTPVTTTPYVATTSGSAKTTWGFKGFNIPSPTVTVNVGDSIQDAINSLSNGGTVKLAAGTHNVTASTNLKSNIVIEGAGRNTTKIKYTGVTNPSTPVRMLKAVGLHNIIIRDMEIDADGNGDTNAVDMVEDVENILIENMNIHGAGRGVITFYGWEGKESKNITVRNVETSYNKGVGHAISIRYGTSILIEGFHAHHIPDGNGIDLSHCDYTEVLNTTIHDTNQGAKFPGSNRLYFHDVSIDTTFYNNLNQGNIGIKINRHTALPAKMHFENVTINNTQAGFKDWGDAYPSPTFEELVLNNVTLTNIKDGQYSFEMKGVNNLYEYGNTIGKVIQRIGLGTLTRRQTTSSPEADGVGYTSWGNP